MVSRPRNSMARTARLSQTQSTDRLDFSRGMLIALPEAERQQPVRE
jgi:hypothetical protein